MSQDTAFNGETAPRHTFLYSDLQCLPPGDPIILCAITGKSFIESTIPGELNEAIYGDTPLTSYPLNTIFDRKGNPFISTIGTPFVYLHVERTLHAFQLPVN